MKSYPDSIHVWSIYLHLGILWDKCKHIHHTLSVWDNEGSILGHLRDMDICFFFLGGGDMFVGICFSRSTPLRLAHAMDPRQQMSKD